MPSTPVKFSATDVIGDAFLDLGVFGPGESIPAEHAQFALRVLNRLVSSLATQPLTFPFINREVFSVVAGQNTYTIGPGGNFNTIKPAEIVGAALLLPSVAVTTGPVEVPISLLSDEAYGSIAVKDLQNAQFTSLRYDATYSGGFGSVYLYPTPNSITNKLVIYRGDVIQGFANLVTLYDFPAGYAEMLQYQLEKRLAPAYGVAWTPEQDDLARTTLFLAKRQNFILVDAVLDTALTGERRGGYDINVGNG